MALLQISEPGQTPDPHQRRIAVGIDLGTTHSLVAVMRHGLPETLPDREGRHLLPSVVRYRPGADPLVGYEALDLAHEDPLNTIASVKRLMGRGVTDVRRLAGVLPYRFAGRETAVPRIVTSAGERTAVEVSADILRVLRRRAEETLATEIHDAVITVPAYFDDAQRQATKDAARLAGLNALRLLNEPTAAAVAYGLDQKPEGMYVIYDLGGGTFDVSLLRLQRGVFEVLATAGDSALGGDDMDHAVAEWILREAAVENADQPALHRLLRDARRAKETLTDSPTATLEFVRPDGSRWNGVLRRELFNELIDPLIERTTAPCRRVLRDARLKAGDIDGVVLVGGATRVPRVRERVHALFGRAPYSDIDPDRVVAIGAAIQADILAGNRPEGGHLLLDVLPLSVGIEIMGGMAEKIIPRNTPIPVARAQDFTTYKDGQTALLVHVVQGERELVSDCRSLARFELRGIPAMAAGAARIRVTFQVDADGLLSVSARELSTGIESHVEVKPSYGLTDSEIETMLRDAIQHAREDETARALREAQVDADRLAEAVEAALRADGEALLSPDERRSIEQSVQELRAARAGDDRKVIRQARERLEAVSRDFAQRRMDRSIRDALAGHRLDEVTKQLPGSDS